MSKRSAPAFDRAPQIRCGRKHDIENHDVDALVDRLVSAVDARVECHDDEAFGRQPLDRVADNRGSSSTSRTLLSVRYFVRHVREGSTPGETGMSWASYAPPLAMTADLLCGALSVPGDAVIPTHPAPT
jgi:hypothetical protein